MRIAMNIAITIAITLAAALAPMQQAHGWAQSCADGNTDACCHLEQIWDVDSSSLMRDVYQVMSHARWATTAWPKQCDPAYQQSFDRAIPLMCATDCWGGAMGVTGS